MRIYLLAVSVRLCEFCAWESIRSTSVIETVPFSIELRQSANVRIWQLRFWIAHLIRNGISIWWRCSGVCGELFAQTHNLYCHKIELVCSAARSSFAEYFLNDSSFRFFLPFFWCSIFFLFLRYPRIVLHCFNKHSMKFLIRSFCFYFQMSVWLSCRCDFNLFYFFLFCILFSIVLPVPLRNINCLLFG